MANTPSRVLFPSGVDKCTARNLGYLVKGRVFDPSPGLRKSRLLIVIFK